MESCAELVKSALPAKSNRTRTCWSEACPRSFQLGFYWSSACGTSRASLAPTLTGDNFRNGVVRSCNVRAKRTVSRLPNPWERTCPRRQCLRRSTPAAIPRGRWYDARLFATGRICAAICASCFSKLCFADSVDSLMTRLRHRGATHAGAAVSTQGT